jgi:hypothetical protein
VVARVLPALGAAARRQLLVSAVLTGLTLFNLGALKVRIAGRSRLASGLEMVLVGGLAAAAASDIGLARSGQAERCQNPFSFPFSSLTFLMNNQRNSLMRVNVSMPVGSES